MALNNLPYIVPVIFGFEDNYLYIHSAKKGKKIDILRQNNKIYIEMDISHEIIKSEQPCHWSIKYQSIICFGKAEFIENPKEKIEAFKVIMNHYSPDIDYQFQGALIENLMIIKIKIEKITGKQSFDI